MSDITSAASAPALKGETRIEQPDRSGRAVARRSAEIRATVPDVELSSDVDAGAALARGERDGVSMTAILVRACATALRELPWANAAYRDGHHELYSRVNVAVTVQAGAALLTPTVLDADTRSLSELADELRRLTERARTGELTPPEQAGATFTLSDFSDHGADRVSPLVIPPQAAALSAGAVRTAPVVRDGQVVAGQLIGLTLACDHRILFGERASALLERIADGVRRPPARASAPSA